MNPLNKSTKDIRIILASVSLGRKELLEKMGVTFTVIPSTINEDKITHSNPIEMLKSRAKAKAMDVVKAISSQTDELSDREVISHQQSDRRAIRQKNYQTLAVRRSESLNLKAESYLILAADSMAILRKSFDFAQDKAYGKAKTKARGRQILEELMGKTHEFVTATTIIYFQSQNSVIPLKKGIRNITDPRLREDDRAIRIWNNITTTRITMRKLNKQELDSYVSWFDFTRFAAGYAINEYPTDLITKIDGSYTNVIGLPFEVILPIFRKYNIV